MTFGLIVWEELPKATTGKHNSLRITAGECLECGHGVIEFTGLEDHRPKYTHDEWTPISQRKHLPLLF